MNPLRFVFSLWLIVGLLSSCGSEIPEAAAYLGLRYSFRQIGVADKTTQSTAIAVDDSSNVYVAGVTAGGLNGNVAVGNSEYFVAKLNSGKQIIWLKQLGVAMHSSRANGMALDASGNIYIAGDTSAGLNGNTQSGNTDYFLAKYDSAGNLLWLRQDGQSAKSSLAQKVAVDSAGNILVVGYTGGGLGGNSQLGLYDYFIAKYAPDGTRTWIKQMGASTVSTYAFALGIDSSNNAYVAGYTGGALNGNSLTGLSDLYVAKYNAAGTLQWLEQDGVASKVSTVSALKIISTDRIIVTGYTSGALGSQSQAGVYDMFVAEYSGSGARQWLTQRGVSDGSVYPGAIAVDSSSSIYVGGTTDRALSIEPQSGDSDYFLTKFSDVGIEAWTKQLGTDPEILMDASCSLTGLATTATSVHFTGNTTGALLGQTQYGTYDFFVGSYDLDGVLQLAE
jgi:hypothetical protein